MSGSMTTERTYRGQRYVIVGSIPYTRRDGTRTTLTRWRSWCPRCGDPFEFSMPTTATKFEPNRRCQKHKRPGSHVSKEAMGS